MEQVRVIELDEVKADIDAIIAANPTRTNNGVCMYVTEDDDGELKPHCIIGQYLFNKGVDLAFLADPFANGSGFGSSVFRARLPLRFAERAAWFLEEVQLRADHHGQGNFPWGEINTQDVFDLVIGIE